MRQSHTTTDRLTGQTKEWRRTNATPVMEAVGGQVTFEAKEGLATINGVTFSAGLAALLTHDAEKLVEHAELVVAMTLEGIRGFRDPFFAEIHEARGHPGAKVAAANILRYTDGSMLLDSGDRNVNPKRVPPQDRYSVRCAPQAIGAARDFLSFIRTIVEIELNAATDNPLIFPDLPREDKVVSGGNFHGDPIAIAMDTLKVIMTKLASISERRTFMLTDYQFADPQINGDIGLPAYLIDEPKESQGLNSGFMIAQYTAAALVSACKTLAHPDSVDSIPSSANQEDYVSMSLNAAHHARDIVDRVEEVIAIEFVCAAQALSLRNARQQGSPGRGTAAALRAIREHVEFLDRDRVLSPDINAVVQLIRSGQLMRDVHDSITSDRL